MSTRSSIKWREKTESHPGFHLYEDALDREPDAPVYLELDGIEASMETARGGASVVLVLQRELACALGVLPAKALQDAQSDSTDRPKVGQSPDALYTMDQMRDYAQSFHRSRMEHLRPRWVRVDDRLPEREQTVLVFRPDAHHRPACDPTIDVREYLGNGKFRSSHEVTHWMPLPAVPTRNSDASSAAKSEICDASSVASKEEPTS
jgi:hypothetical protein